MLKRIVQTILEGGMKSKQEIARKLGIQMETLEDMLRILLDRGVLRVSECEAPESSVCSSCPSSQSGCHSDIIGQTYFVTEKGLKYAKS